MAHEYKIENGKLVRVETHDKKLTLEEANQMYLNSAKARETYQEKILDHEKRMEALQPHAQKAWKVGFQAYLSKAHYGNQQAANLAQGFLRMLESTGASIDDVKVAILYAFVYPRMNNEFFSSVPYREEVE